MFSTSMSPVFGVVSGVPAFPARSLKAQEKVTSPFVSPSATSMDTVQDVPEPL